MPCLRQAEGPGVGVSKVHTLIGVLRSWPFTQRYWRAAVYATVVSCLPVAGCAFGLGVTGGPSLSLSGDGGGEGSVHGFLEHGSAESPVRYYAALSAGGGYHEALGEGYVLLGEELGLGFGDDHRFYLAGHAAARLASEVFWGGGVSVTYFAAVADHGSDGGHIDLGTRLSLEAVEGPQPDQFFGLLTLSITLRWVLVDTTGRPFRESW